MISRNSSKHFSGFTIIELITAMGVFGVFSVSLVASWIALQTTAMNAAAYAQRQCDQGRVLDYLRRDIRRASQLEIYSGATLVTGTNSGAELKLTIPDYYADTREEDNAFGTSTPNTPIMTSGLVNYGATMTVRYYVLNGAVIRSEAAAPRTIADADGSFTLSFAKESTGDVRCRLSYNQAMRGGGSRVLRREIDTLCRQRSDLQL